MTEQQLLAARIDMEILITEREEAKYAAEGYEGTARTLNNIASDLRTLIRSIAPNQEV